MWLATVSQRADAVTIGPVAHRLAASRRVPLVVTAPLVAYAIAAVFVPRAYDVLSTNGSVSPIAHAADLAAGLSLLAAGLLALAEPTRRHFGVLASLASVVWFAPDWEGWEAGPGLVRSLGAAAAPLFLALVFHLAASGVRSRLLPDAVRAVYAVAAGLSVTQAFFRDPFLDPYCWRNCVGNSFLLWSDTGTTRAVGHAAIGVEIALGLAVIAVAGWRLLATARAHLLAVAPMLFPAAIAGGTAVAHAAAVWRNPLEVQHGAVFRAIYLVFAFSIAALAAGTGWNIVVVRGTRRAVDRLVTDLANAPPPGGLQRALAAALGDPAVSVHYWLPDSETFVDREGKPSAPPSPESGRAMTSITRSGNPIAVVSSDIALLDGTDLERRIGSAARLAVENERLRAEVLARLISVRESRARIVDTADATRQRLERDLHDGAQQRLLALSYQLRLAHDQALADGNGELAVLIQRARDDAGTALDDLRQLAHGIYPAVLTEAGLEAALTTLAEGAALPVELAEMSLSRLPAAVETAAYATVAEAVDDATVRGATFVTVAASQEDGLLVIEVEDDGRARTSPPSAVDDRVGAIGGSADVGPSGLRAVLPCA